MSDSYVVYEKQPTSNYQTQGQWILRCYSMIMFWCIAPPSFSKNWWNTALVCYHTRHILKTWPHATLLFAWQENTVWWPLWQCTKCQGCFNKGSLLDRRRSIPELLPRPLHLLPEMGLFITCFPCSTNFNPKLVIRELSVCSSTCIILQ